MPADGDHGSVKLLTGLRRPAVNLDWTRDPPPPNLTPYKQLIRDIDWSRTALGPMNAWSRELRQTVLMMMAEVNPVIVYWGEDNTMIYNEAYIPLIGDTHPEQLGMNARDAFPQFWDFFDAIIAEQRQTGETKIGEASMLLMHRKGFIEEAYFDWKLIPIIGDDGTMVGDYGEPTESTFEIIGRRRIASIQHLSQQASTADSLEELWKSTVDVIKSNARDFPLVMLYSVKQPAKTSPDALVSETFQCTLQQASSVPPNALCAKTLVDLREDLGLLGSAMLEACCRGQMVEVDVTEPLEAVLSNVEWQGFGIPSTKLAVLPVMSRGSVEALLVLGLNPRLQLDEPYRDYLKILYDTLSPQVARVRLAEEIKKRTEAASRAALEFKQSEIKFSRFAERSPVGLALTDVSGKILYANDFWLQFTGLDRYDVDLTSWIDTVHESDVPMIHTHWHRASVLKEAATFQVRSKTPFESGHMKSECRTAMCAIYPDLDHDGNVISIMGLVLDISEQKWVESQLLLRKQELEESEAKYRNFAERSPHGVVRTDADGYVQFGNDAWHSFYGFQRGNVTGPEPWVEQLDEESQPKAKEFFQDIKERRGTPLTVEVRHKRRTRVPISGDLSSDEMWLMATGWAEMRGDGTIEHVVFWVTDITAQKAATKVLENKMEEAIRLRTQQERFIDMISHEIRNPLSAVLHCGEEIVDSMKRCLTAMDALPNPDQLDPKEGALQTLIRDQINSSLDASNTIMYCVQHQKQIVDDVLTLSKLDSDLLLVTPIAVQLTELFHSVMKIFNSEARASDIQLKLDMDKSILESESDWVMLDPNRFLQIVINLVTNAIKFTRNADVRQVIIRMSARSTRPPREHEGVQYVPQKPQPPEREGERTQSMVDNSDENTIYLCFSVSDTGRGLTETEKQSLFNRFTQASPKTHVEYGGSGLGLFISRQITELLGGEIGVGAGSEGGCTFAFFIKSSRVSAPSRRESVPGAADAYAKTLVEPSPKTWVTASTTEESAMIKQAPQPSTPEPLPLKRKVLVVEDNVINQKVLCKQLRGRGFVVEAANHGLEALDKLQKHKDEAPGSKSYFDVILCDIEMPVMDGIQCVTEVRRREHDGLLPGHVPIIGVTANVRSKQVNTAIEVGMDGVTTKPYRIDELVAHVDRVCAEVNTSTAFQ